MAKLNKRQKLAEMRRQIRKEIIPDIRKLLLENAEKLINSGEMPDHFYEKESALAVKAIVDSMCRNRPYRPLLKSTERDYYNIYLML